MSADGLHRTPVEIRLRDTDMFGHVNNAAYATYVEIARIAFLRDRLGASRERPFGQLGGVILARLAIDFKRQLLLGEEAEVTTEVEKIGRSSISLVQQVLANGEVAAHVTSVVVAYDYEAQKSLEIPAELRERLMTGSSTSGTGSEGTVAEGAATDGVR